MARDGGVSAPGSGARPLGVGIVGPGLVGAVHAAALARIPAARLIAVAGSSAGSERAAQFAREHDARAAAFVDLIQDADVELVIVATPHPLHAALAIQAAEHGKHVLVEKPMALHAADCLAMADAARAAGTVLSVVSQRRWYPASRRVKAAIEEGRIGRPALATVELLGWRSREYYAMDAWRGTLAGEGGGVLVNQAIHQLDLLCWFLGEPLVVDGWTANVNHPEIEVEDTAVAIARFGEGALATIAASNSQRPGLHGWVHIHGTSGASVGVETDRGSSFVAGVSLPSEPRNDIWTIPGEEALPERWLEEDRAQLAGVDVATHFHELQLRDVVAAIRDGREPAVTAEDGRRSVALRAAIADASAAGGRVTLSPGGRSG